MMDMLEVVEVALELVQELVDQQHPENDYTMELIMEIHEILKRCWKR